MALDTSQAILFDEVFRQELDQVGKSRESRLRKGDKPAVEKDLVGLALSGGGVRSATFSLGVLQGLARHGLLSRVDYLSSTGGGGYAAGWLLSWIRARGYREVEEQLAGKSGAVEAPEIQGLRLATVSPPSRGLTPNSNAVLAWVRNVALNLIALTALLAAFLLLIKAGLTSVAHLPSVPRATEAAAVLTGVSALLLGLLSLQPDQLDFFPALRHLKLLMSHALRTRIFWAAVVLSIAASALSSLVVILGLPWYGPPWWVVGAGVIAGFCALAWFPHWRDYRTLLFHLASSAVAGAAGGALLYLISGGGLPPPAFDEGGVLIVTALVVLIGASSLFLYTLLMRRRLPREIREHFRRFYKALFNLAILWLVVLFVWFNMPLPPSVWVLLAAAPLLIAGGLARPAGVHHVTRATKVVLDVLERLAPYVFVLALVAFVAALLSLFPNLTFTWRDDLVVAFVLLLISGLLLWGIRVAGFNMHSFHRTRIARDFLVPAGGEDVMLGDAAGPPDHAGPYTLFGAALDVLEAPPAGPLQTRTVAASFSTLFSGYEAVRALEEKGAYRPTEKLGGGISLATAMAISKPIHPRPLRPSSAAVSMLWTIFDLHDGRLMGNAARDDTWYKSGPLVGPLYALREGFGDRTGTPAYVRPSPGREFDNLGIYQLVKRRCRFIIACDATSDPDFSFQHLGATIRKCRVELGVEIQMDLGPLGRTPTTASAHYQVAHIRYAEGETGLIIYVKPSLTGDEPTDLGSYAKAHPEFPAADLPGGGFSDSDSESYRRLGEHIVESLLKGIQIEDEIGTGQVFRHIRGVLQPDFVEPEDAPVPLSDELTTPPPGELVDAVASGECVLFAGPGLAAQAKLPTWSAFIDGLLRVARENGHVDAAGAAGLTATLAAGEVEAVADELIHQVPRDFLLNYVNEVTAAPEPSEAHQILSQMPFLGAINAYLDDTLASAFGIRALVPSQAQKLIAELQAKRRFVANVFGAASQPASLLFTVKEFRQLLSANLEFRQFLGTLFLRYTVVFVGSSVDGIRDFLDALELPQSSERKHYALIPNAGQLDPVRVRYVERSYNVSVIDFQPGFNYAGLPAFLKQLQAEVNEKAPRPKASDALTLKSITLDNIGPFDSLHLDLSPSWNLLLGDNGVGKTIVLKAIAAALCGERADAAAVARLLKSGAPSGSIRLRVESREYVVDLKRDDGSVRIASASLSPIKYDKWLALGFPALRSIPWDRPKGPSPPKLEAPSADDLLPILLGEPDDRIADIKQWLINLDYGSKSEATAARSKMLLKVFFEVMQRLTPDMRLEFHAVNDKTMEITVKTDGGVVPLEAVSQGTGSVMCWIGTLLERLAETGSARDPRENPALVLIDELDAHMHPKWQQSFVAAFSDQFEKVQIIATTHSPLIVGGMPARQVTRFMKGKDGKVFIAPITPDMTMGYSDQILTSPLFGLPTTLDETTTDRKMERFYELERMQNRSAPQEEEYEQLRRELMVRVPPQSATYMEKREGQYAEVDMLKALGEKLHASSPDGAKQLLERAENIRQHLEGDNSDDKS